MMEGPQSSTSSDNTSQFSACYDAEKGCIRLLGGGILEGSIIEMEQTEQSGTFMIGEVMEIVIMGDNMIPLAVHNEKVRNIAPPTSTSTYPQDVTSDSRPKKYVYDELRRSEIQSLMRDKSLGRDEKLRRMAEIKAKYKDHHSDASSSSESVPPVNNAEADSSESIHSRVVHRWNKAAVAAVSVNTVKQIVNNSEQLNAKTIQQPKSPAKNNPEKQAPENTPQTSSTEISPPSLTTASNRWNRAAVVAVSAKSIRDTIKTAQPCEQQKIINQEDIDDIIQRLRQNDPSLTTLILDGRRFDDSRWDGLFDSIEENKLLTELSVVNCGLNDSTVGALVLALVENETLMSINLSCNKDLTDDTGEGLRKVLKQGNAFVKKMNIEDTSISSTVADKIQTILIERDDNVKLAKLQEARQAKIKALLSHSASDEVLRARRISSQQKDEDNEDEEKDGTQMPAKKGSTRSIHSSGSQRSGESRSRRGNFEALNSRRGSFEAGRPSPNNKFATAVRASMVTRQMANLGGDVVHHVGKTAAQLRELRKQRGECEHCGQKCFSKTLFKTIPLSIPDKVHEGRCLICVQFT